MLARTELLRLQGEVQNFERLTKSTQWHILSEDDKKAMNVSIVSARQRVQDKQEQIGATLAKLIPTKYTFVSPPSTRQSDAVFLNMTNTQSSLQQDVLALFEEVTKLEAAALPLQTPVAPLAPASSKAEADVVLPESTSRPKKRRRLSMDGAATSSEPTTKVSDPTAADFDRLQDVLSALEGRLVGVENDMLQYDDKVSDEVETQLDYLGLSRGKGAGSATNEELTERVEKLKSDMLQAEANAAAVTSGLAQLKLDGEGQDKRNAELCAENERLREQIAEVCNRYACPVSSPVSYFYVNACV